MFIDVKQLIFARLKSINYIAYDSRIWSTVKSTRANYSSVWLFFDAVPSFLAVVRQIKKYSLIRYEKQVVLELKKKNDAIN